jgi:hypothetical protein
MPCDDPIGTIPATEQRRLVVSEPLHIELFVLVGELTHRRVIDGGGYLDQLTQQLVSARRA